jgi:hypothetical protein
MSWKNDLPRKVMSGDRASRSTSSYLIGRVLSPRWSEADQAWTDGELIISAMGGNAMLTSGMLDRLGAGGKLHEGMTVILIPGERALHGGQRFFVLEIPGHGDTAGRDAEDSHPIEAITGLRGELDDHDGRLEDLEHDMNDSGGKVALLTARVADLETTMTELWTWYQAHKDDA